jgi:hypothetical protein
VVVKFFLEFGHGFLHGLRVDRLQFLCLRLINLNLQLRAAAARSIGLCNPRIIAF